MAMPFQGREFTVEMKQLVINLKLHFDAERKSQKEVSTRNPTLRTAQALGIGEITVKRIMAEYRHNGATLKDHAPKSRGKPDCHAAVNLQPVIREYVRTKNLAGQRVGVEKLREFLFDTHGADIAPVTLWRTLQRWVFVWDRETTVSTERTSICGPCKTTLFASETRQSQSRWQSQAARGVPR